MIVPFLRTHSRRHSAYLYGRCTVGRRFNLTRFLILPIRSSRFVCVGRSFSCFSTLKSKKSRYIDNTNSGGTFHPLAQFALKLCNGLLWKPQCSLLQSVRELQTRRNPAATRQSDLNIGNSILSAYIQL